VSVFGEQVSPAQRALGEGPERRSARSAIGRRRHQLFERSDVT